MMRAIALSFGLAAATTLDASKERPIMKVVRLLEDMSSELNKELEDDKAVHEMLDCWYKRQGEVRCNCCRRGQAV
jgi:outer membrane lipoprotein-sorting protein